MSLPWMYVYVELTIRKISYNFPEGYLLRRKR